MLIKIKRNFHLAFLVFIFGCFSSEHVSNSPKNYINGVFEIIEKYSIRRDSINLDRLKEEVFSGMKDVKTIEDCHPIIISILKKLGDNHSSFMEKEGLIRLRTTSLNKDKNTIITFKGELLAEHIGYLQLDGFLSADTITMSKYADSLQKLIKLIDKKDLKGWIIDLRNNDGGNCWPMIVGLGPILGDGLFGYFIDVEKKKLTCITKKVLPAWINIEF